MNSRRTVSLLVLPAALALASCSSSTAGSGSSSSSPPDTSAASTSSAPVSSSSAPATTAPASSSSASGGTGAASGLADRMLQGISNTTSAHIALSIGVGGQAITGTGDEKLSSGKLTALDLSEQIPGGGSLRLIIAQGKTYVKLPSSANQSGKPYVLVRAGSSDPIVRQLASSLASTQSSASLANTVAFVTAADSVKTVGAVNVGGVATTRYDVNVNINKLPSTYPGKAALLQTGVTSLPVQLFLDSTGRPVQVLENLTISGKAVTTKVTVSKYNVPVSISAPPASQVSTK